MFRDVTRERARSVTRVGQVAAVALASLAGVVFAVGIPGIGIPKFERPPAPEQMKVPEPTGMTDMPAIMEKRAAVIAKNLSQIGNAPKPPPEIAQAENPDEMGMVETPPPPPVPDMAFVYLGQLGSGSHPMALVSIDSHQQVLAVGDTIHKSSGEAVKLVKVSKDAIELEVRGATKKIELAPRSGPTVTSLQNTPAAPTNPGIVPAPGGQPPTFNRPNRGGNVDMRAPGNRPPRPPRPDESGGGSRE